MIDSDDRMQKMIIEINTDYKSKIIRQRKVFMEYMLKAFSSRSDSHEDARKKLLEYGVKIIGERDAGDDLLVKINGDVIYPDHSSWK